MRDSVALPLEELAAEVTEVAKEKTYTFLFDRHPGTGTEFLRALPVSGITSVIDIGVLILLTEYAGLHYLLSACIGFALGQVWSYIASTKWVFSSCSASSHWTGFPLFLMLSVVGLLIMELILWTTTEHFALYYLYSKLIASALTSLILFLLRKRLLFS